MSQIQKVKVEPSFFARSPKQWIWFHPECQSDGMYSRISRGPFPNQLDACIAAEWHVLLIHGGRLKDPVTQITLDKK